MKLFKPKRKYIYEAKVLKVIDGDTFKIGIDLGFKVHKVETIRLKGCDTPEIRGKERKEGLKVKAYVDRLIRNKTVLVKTFKSGKYGRYICEIYLGKRRKPLSSRLIKKGFAERYRE